MGHYNLVFTATIHADPTPENKYLYVDLTGVADYTVAEGDWLEYEIFQADAAGRMGVDLGCSNGTVLRNSGAVDQEGRSAHPNTLLPSGEWYTRKIPLSALVGKTVTKYYLACENDQGGSFTGIFRSIRIKNGTQVKRSIWEITDDVPASAIDRTDTVGANSYDLFRSMNTAPSTPKDTVVSAVSPTAVQVSWVDTTNEGDPGWTKPDWWEVELATEPTFAAPLRATVSPRATVQYTFSDIARNTLYYARVRGVNLYLGQSGWAVLSSGATLFEVSDTIVTGQGQPVAGKALVLDYATIMGWQSGAVPVLASGTTNTGAIQVTGQNDEKPFVVLVIENNPNPSYSGNVYVQE